MLLGSHRTVGMRGGDAALGGTARLWGFLGQGNPEISTGMARKRWSYYSMSTVTLAFESPSRQILSRAGFLYRGLKKVI